MTPTVSGADTNGVRTPGKRNMNTPWEADATVNKDGSVVIKTFNMGNNSKTPMKLIFRRAEGGWLLVTCLPGCGPIPLTYEQANILAQALRIPRGDE
jgi:hypothetical protein